MRFLERCYDSEDVLFRIRGWRERLGLSDLLRECGLEDHYERFRDYGVDYDFDVLLLDCTDYPHLGITAEQAHDLTSTYLQVSWGESKQG